MVNDAACHVGSSDSEMAYITKNLDTPQRAGCRGFFMVLITLRDVERESVHEHHMFRSLASVFILCSMHTSRVSRREGSGNIIATRIAMNIQNFSAKE